MFTVAPQFLSHQTPTFWLLEYVLLIALPLSLVTKPNDQLKLSQAALACIFNIGQSTVQNWEQGHKRLVHQKNY
jgi:hypothetical protein